MIPAGFLHIPEVGASSARPSFATRLTPKPERRPKRRRVICVKWFSHEPERRPYDAPIHRDFRKNCVHKRLPHESERSLRPNRNAGLSPLPLPTAPHVPYQEACP